MARTTILAISTPLDTGYDLTGSSDFTTLGVGADNGVEFGYAQNNKIFLLHSAAAVFTVKVIQDAKYVAVGSTVPDVTVTTGAAETFIYIPNPAINIGSRIQIDCDVAGTVLVLA